MRSKLLVWLPAIALVLLIVWRLGVNRNEKAAQVEAATRRKNAPVNVRAATATLRDIIHTFQGFANVTAPADIRIAPKVTGLLIYLERREGDPVKKGEVLARIDPSQAQAAVNQQQAAVDSARANLGNAQMKFRRYDSLYRQGFVSAQERDDYRSQVDVESSALRAAQAQLSNAQSQLSDTTLRSPINGFVTARFLDPGSVITAGQSVLAVQAMRNVYITTSVPEGVNRQVHVGMAATVESDEMPGRTFTGRVSQVNPAADPQSRQFLVRATLPNEQGLLRPGMFCRMTLVTSVTRNAVVVPHEAVQQGPKGQTVVVIDDSMKTHRRQVQTGDDDPAGVQITQGVKAGDSVVTLATQPLKDGQLVRVDKSVQPGAPTSQPTIIGGGGAPEGSNSMRPAGGGASAPTYGGTGAAAGLSGGSAFNGPASSSTSANLGGSGSAPSSSPGAAPTGGTLPSLGGTSGAATSGNSSLRTPPPGFLTPQVNNRLSSPFTSSSGTTSANRPSTGTSGSVIGGAPSGAGTSGGSQGGGGR